MGPAISRNPEIFQKIHHISYLLYYISCCVKLVKIPSHKGIHGNVLADQNAKEHAQEILNGKISAPRVISFSDARQMATEIAKKSGQRRWSEETKGRSTFEFIPVVGTRIIWPKSRDIGISYCRMLLHDTMLNKDSYRTGTSDTALCECGED